MSQSASIIRTEMGAQRESFGHSPKKPRVPATLAESS